MKKVFISHSSMDDEFVNMLAKHLKKHQIDTFVDHHVIKPGMVWTEEVINALDSCNQMIAVISSRSVLSRNCRNEWYDFVAKKKEIIPAWLDGEMFLEFIQLQRVDFRKRDAYDQNVKMLIDNLRDDIVTSPSLAGTLNLPTDGVLPARLHLHYELQRKKGKAVGIATGNICELIGIDSIVNSENTELEMDHIWNHTVSGSLNAHAAKRDEWGDVIEKTLENELAQAKASITEIQLTNVVVTGSGSLVNNGVQKIIHAVTVEAGPARLVPGTLVQLGRCTFNALHAIDKINRTDLAHSPLKSVVFPIFGTGNAGLGIKEVAHRMLEVAIEYLEFEDTRIEEIYFVAYKRQNCSDLEDLSSHVGTDLDDPRPFIK